MSSTRDKIVTINFKTFCMNVSPLGVMYFKCSWYKRSEIWIIILGLQALWFQDHAIQHDIVLFLLLFLQSYLNLMVSEVSSKGGITLITITSPIIIVIFRTENTKVDITLSS